MISRTRLSGKNTHSDRKHAFRLSRTARSSSGKLLVTRTFPSNSSGFCTDICVVSNALILKANFYENEISRRFFLLRGRDARNAPRRVGDDENVPDKCKMIYGTEYIQPEQVIKPSEGKSMKNVVFAVQIRTMTQSSPVRPAAARTPSEVGAEQGSTLNGAQTISQPSSFQFNPNSLPLMPNRVAAPVRENIVAGAVGAFFILVDRCCALRFDLSGKYHFRYLRTCDFCSCKFRLRCFARTKNRSSVRT